MRRVKVESLARISNCLPCVYNEWALSCFRVLLNCCGMFDVLTFDPTASNPMAAMAHYQQEDLISLGKIVLGTLMYFYECDMTGFFWTFRKKLKAKKTQAEKNSSKFSKKLKQISRKLNISPTRINFFFPQKLII